MKGGTAEQTLELWAQEELARGHMSIVGSYRGHLIYSGRFYRVFFSVIADLGVIAAPEFPLVKDAIDQALADRKAAIECLMNTDFWACGLPGEDPDEGSKPGRLN